MLTVIACIFVCAFVAMNLTTSIPAIAKMDKGSRVPIIINLSLSTIIEIAMTIIAMIAIAD